MGAPKWPPSPHTFAAPRRSRGASLEYLARAGARNGPQGRTRSQRPGGAVALLWSTWLVRGPEMAPKPPHVRSAPAEPWRFSGVLGSCGAPKWPKPPDVRSVPASRDAALGHASLL